MEREIIDELNLQWQCTKVECKPGTQQYILNVKEMSFGSILSKLTSGFTTGFELPTPWNILNEINLKDFQLVADNRTGEIKLTYKISLDLDFIKIDHINLTKDKTGVFLGFEGSFLGMKIEEGNEFTKALAGKGCNVKNMPDASVDVSGFDLALLVLGQRIAPTGTEGYKSVDDMIQILEKAFKDTNDKPNAIPICDTGMVFNPEANWLIGAKFTLADFLQVSFIFNDHPSLYGLGVKLTDEAPCLKDFQFSILYKKVSDTIGAFQTVLQLPKDLRDIKLGTVTLTLPNIGIQIYTNGDFYLDLGWPESFKDFSRCFTLGITPYTGSGGLYFASLSGETATDLPTVSNGTFYPVIEAGLALSFGIGENVNGGIFKASISVSVVGMLEGTYAVFKAADGLPVYSGMSDTYYRFKGTLALVGKVTCEVNFAIITASLEATAYILAAIVFEAYKAIPLYFEVGISMKLSVKINLGLFKITLKLDFSAKISTSFTIGSDNEKDSLWYKVDHLDVQHNGMYRPLTLSGDDFSPTWKPIVTGEETYHLLLHFIPQLTASNDEDASQGEDTHKRPLYVAMLYLDHEEDDTTGHSGITALALGCYYWAMGAILGNKSKDGKLTLTWLREQEITADEINRLTTYMEQVETSVPFSYRDDSGNDARSFMQNFFRIRISSPEWKQEEEHTASVFPMIPDLTLTKTLNGIADSICFSEGPALVGPDYIQKVQELFDSIKATNQNNRGRAAQAKRANLYDTNVTDNQSLSSYVFSDYLALVVKQVLQAASEYLSDQGMTSMNVEDLAQIAIKGKEASQGPAAKIGAMASRFLLYGLRLPVPSGNSLTDTAPMYALTGQQWEIPLRHGAEEYEYSVSLQAENQENYWISVGDKGDGLLISINDELEQRNEQMADVVFAPSVINGYPRAIANIKVVPQSFSMGNNTLWNFPGTLFDTGDKNTDNTSLNVWKLPPSFKSALKENKGKELEFNIRTITQTGKTTEEGEIKKMKWATLATVKVKKMDASAADSDLSANVYELIGTDDTTAHVLEALIHHIQLKGNATFIEQIRILMQTDPQSGKENWTSLDDGCVRLAIVKANMSTETHPEANVVMGAKTDCNTLNTPEEFITYLWECSSVRSGGFYFYYEVNGGHDGLPEYLFDDDGMASVQMLVTYSDFIPETFLNGVVTGDDLDFAKTTVYLQSPALTMAIPVIPQGCVGYELLRKPMQDAENRQTSVLPTKNEDRFYLENQFNLLGALLPGLKTYQNYMPAGPLLSDDDDEKEEAWNYCAVIPYYKLKGVETGESGYPNPYIGIGDNVEIKLLWQDMFGNTMAGNPMSVSMPVLYTDTIINLSQWPSVSSQYIFRKESDKQAAFLNLYFRFDSSRYEDEKNGKANALADLDVYMKLLYQLQTGDMAVKILSTIQGTKENEEGFTALVDIDGLITGLISPIIAYLSGTSLTPPSTFTLQETVEQELVANYCDSIPLRVRLVMERLRNVSPDLTESSGVASVSTVIQPYSSNDPEETSLATFAQEFENAFANGSILIKIATSSETQGEEGKDIWMIRLDETGKNGIKITYKSTNASFFSPRPLATSLQSFSVPIAPYRSGEAYPAGKETVKSFMAVDLDVWGRQFMEAVDDFLSPRTAVPAFLLDNGVSLSEITDLKEQIANAISGTVDYIITPDQTKDTCLVNAQEKWRQEILKKLSSAYLFTAAVQIPADVCSSWELPNQDQRQGINDTPKFYGKIAADKTSTVQDFSLSTSKLPLGKGKSWLTYMFGCKEASGSRNCRLDDVRFEITHLEQDIKGIGIGGYTSSQWLSFILPLDIKLQDTGGVTIPIPLRAYPVAPTVTSQKVTYKETTDLNDALRWDFNFTYKNPTSAQDTVGIQLVLNTPGKDANEIKKDGSPDLRQALAQFMESYPQISEDFNSYLIDRDENLVDKAKNAVNAFKEIIREVSDAWSSWNQVDANLVDKQMEVSSAEAIILRYKVIEMEDEDGSLCIEVVPDTGNALDLIPEVLIPGYDAKERKTDESGVRTFIYQDANTGTPLAYANRNANPSRTVNIPQMNVLDIQNAWGGVQVVRNEELVQDNHGEWLTTNSHFLYRTPVTMFYAKQIPLLQDNKVIDLSTLVSKSPSIETCIEALFSTMADSMKLLSEMSVKVEINYCYPISGDNVNVTLPLFLTLPVSLNVKDKGTGFSKALADKLLQKLNESGLPDGWFDIRLTVYSLLDEDVPVLQLPFTLRNSIKR